MKEQRPWAVTPHNPIEKIDDNLWAVEAKMPGMPIRRRMCIVKRSDGTLLFFHAIPLDDAELDEIRAWGKPAYLVVGHDQHMVDAHAFKEKLGLKLYGPKERKEQINMRSPLDGTLEDIPSDPSVSIQSVPGSKLGEAVAIVSSGGGARVSLLFCDVIQNSPGSMTALPFRLLGFSGDHPKVVPTFRLLFTSDRAALKKALMNWADMQNLTRIVPFHGTIVETGAAAALRTAAREL